MDVISKIGGYLLGLRYSRFLILFIFILLVRNGLSPIGEEYVGWLRQASINYPDPVIYLISSPIPILLMKILGYPATFLWWSLGLIIFVLWICISLFYISSNFKNNQKIVTVLFLASTPVAVAMSMIGHIDVYTLFGATIAVFGKFRGNILLGAILAAGGNSDQAIATTICLSFLAFSRSKLAKRIFYRWALVSTIAYLSLHLSVKIPSVHDPKQVLLAELPVVILNSFSIWHFLLYSFLGILWIPWFFFVFQKIANFREKIFTFIGVIALPFAMSFLILDGTRVGITVGYIALLISFKDKFNDEIISERTTTICLGALFIYLILIPNVVVDSGGSLRIPVAKFLGLLNS